MKDIPHLPGYGGFKSRELRFIGNSQLVSEIMMEKAAALDKLFYHRSLAQVNVLSSSRISPKYFCTRPKYVVPSNSRQGIENYYGRMDEIFEIFPPGTDFKAIKEPIIIRETYLGMPNQYLNMPEGYNLFTLKYAPNVACMHLDSCLGRINYADCKESIDPAKYDTYYALRLSGQGSGLEWTDFITSWLVEYAWGVKSQGLACTYKVLKPLK